MSCTAMIPSPTFGWQAKIPILDNSTYKPVFFRAFRPWLTKAAYIFGCEIKKDSSVTTQARLDPQVGTHARRVRNLDLIVRK